MKQANKRAFSKETGEYGDDAMGLTLGMLDTKEGGNLRIASEKRKMRQANTKASRKRAIQMSSGATNGLASSMVFTPVQGLELGRGHDRGVVIAGLGHAEQAVGDVEQARALALEPDQRGVGLGEGHAAEVPVGRPVVVRGVVQRVGLPVDQGLGPREDPVGVEIEVAKLHALGPAGLKG